MPNLTASSGNGFFAKSQASSENYGGKIALLRCLFSFKIVISLWSIESMDKIYNSYGNAQASMATGGGCSSNGCSSKNFLDALGNSNECGGGACSEPCTSQSTSQHFSMGLTASQKCEDSSTNFRAILQKRKLEDAKMPNAKCRVVIRVSPEHPGHTTRSQASRKVKFFVLPERKR